jgi:hypothetical protein
VPPTTRCQAVMLLLCCNSKAVCHACVVQALLLEGHDLFTPVNLGAQLLEAHALEVSEHHPVRGVLQTTTLLCSLQPSYP